MTTTTDLATTLSSNSYLSTALVFSPPPSMSVEEADRLIDKMNLEVHVENLARRLAAGNITAEDFLEAMRDIAPLLAA
jgi:hypothetical protein